jgi:hypothetical protein
MNPNERIIMNEEDMTMPQISLVLGVATVASAVAVGLVLKKIYGKPKRFQHPSAEDSELYKF